MYFVDREAIEEKLQYLEKLTALAESRQTWTETMVDELALERLVQTMLDVVLDVGNAMIDGFIMRDPGSYEDIVDILVDEKVIGEELERSFKAMLPHRRELVQHYTTIDHQQLKQAVEQHLKAFVDYPGHIRSYLENELGTVSAFKPVK